MTREEVITHMKVMGENAAKMDEVMMYVMTQKDCEVVMAAAELLKEQEPVAPVLQSGGNYVCGSCGMYTVGHQHPITGQNVKTWKYCPACGRKVRWE